MAGDGLIHKRQPGNFSAGRDNRIGAYSRTIADNRAEFAHLRIHHRIAEAKADELVFELISIVGVNVLPSA